jgi:antitoxin component YwqK of YwqJK toxin-antitoxin module
MRKIFISLFLLFGILKLSAQNYGIELIKNRVTVSQDTLKATFFITDKTPRHLKDKSFYYWYTGNQLNITQGGYSGRLLDGDFKSFYAHKNIKEQGEFKKGLKSGNWKSWYPNGVLQQKVAWSSGDKDGAFQEFDARGELLREGLHKANELHGRTTVYHGKDSVAYLYYKKGKLINKESNFLNKWIDKFKKLRLPSFKKQSKKDNQEL